MSETTAESLYQRVGGTEAVKALVEELHERLLSDSRLSHIFSQVKDLPRLRSHTVKMLVAALGGPNDYAGRDMASAHFGYPIGHTEFTIVIEHIGAAATEVGLSEDLISEIRNILEPLRREIVQI